MYFNSGTIRLKIEESLLRHIKMRVSITSLADIIQLYFTFRLTSKFKKYLG